MMNNKKKKKKKTEQLKNENYYEVLKKLKNQRNLTWNKNGELIYKGTLIPSSHISKLLKNAFSNDTTNVLKGMKTFYKVLKQINISPSIIINSVGKKLLSKTESKRYMRPPGKLVYNKGKTEKASFTPWQLTGKEILN